MGSSIMDVSGSAPSFTCRAWVNFNGTGAVAIRGSGNVSSITDNGAGNYTVNFASAMPDTNYNIVGNIRSNSPGNSSAYGMSLQQGDTKTTSQSQVRAYVVNAGGNGFFDTEEMNVTIFR